MSIDIKLKSGKLNLENSTDRETFLTLLKTKHHNIHEYVHYLSTTTDDFRNFFNPHKQKEDVSLITPIKRALEIVEQPMRSNGTGLGLYMSKIMIEDHHQGLLQIKNTKEGLCCKIIFNIN
ncbi:MAG: hypothetical protein U9O64_03265 [Campylobacterota bacterium]|nr:hypothetical protein [Campylobacterota bacterium]